MKASPAVRNWITCALIFAIFVSALLLRSLNYGDVFHQNRIDFQDNDAYFHMRTIRNLMHHFPHRSGFDPYSGFPTGQAVTTGPLFDLMVGTTAWIAGWGSPTENLVDRVGAWFPAILGALIALPVFFLGRELFGSASGLLAAALAATLPGSLLKESRLGLPDHHVAEVFFSTLVLLFLVLALRKSKAIFTLLGGVSLGCFLDTRPAGVFLVAGIAAWAVLEIAADHWRGKDCRKVAGIVLATFLLAWILFLPTSGLIWSDFTSLGLGTGIAAVAFTAGCSMVLARRGTPRWLHAAILAAAGLVFFAAVLWLRPRELASLAHTLLRYAEPGPTRTVRELRPILELDGRFSLHEVWQQFGLSWIVALAAMISLALESPKRPAYRLLLMWSALMLAGTLFQNRMSYFFAICVALLCGYFCSRMMQIGESRGRGPIDGWIAAALALILLAPNIAYAIPAVETPEAEPDNWHAALAWLRSNTPEPMGDASAFDRYYPALGPGEIFHYPASAYGIMNWWDFGHLISAEGRRIPVSNGMQTGAAAAARFFLSTEPQQARRLLRESGARYVIADATLPLPAVGHISSGNGHFRVMPEWAGKNIGDYSEFYVAPTADGGLQPVAIFYPDYYRSMLARLYLFDGKAVTPRHSTWVIVYRREKGYRRIVESRNFETYEEAAEYLSAHPLDRMVLAGLDPLKSCVPLEAMPDLRLAFNSQPGPLGADGKRIEAVKIFEFDPRP